MVKKFFFIFLCAALMVLTISAAASAQEEEPATNFNPGGPSINDGNGFNPGGPSINDGNGFDPGGPSIDDGGFAPSATVPAGQDQVEEEPDNSGAEIGSLGGSDAPRFENIETFASNRLLRLGLNWLTWFGLVVGVGGLIVIGIQLLISRRNRSAQAASAISGAPWIIVGLVILGMSSVVANWVLERSLVEVSVADVVQADPLEGLGLEECFKNGGGASCEERGR